MSDVQKLSAHVGRELSDGEIAEQWTSIERRLGEHRVRRPMRAMPLFAAALASVLAVAAVLFFVHRRATPSVWDGAILDSGADRVSVVLGDGSHIALLPESRVAVVEGSRRSVRLDVQKGSAHFDVTHVEGRTFSVRSGQVSIRVVGTRFTVTSSKVPNGGRVTVSVEEGAVEAESAPGTLPIRIAAGQTWSTVQTTAPTEPPSAPSATTSAEIEPAAPSSGPSVPPLGEPKEPVASTTERGSPSKERPKAEPGAQELFESANAARQSGDARGAAAYYESLLRHHPEDARAGLAAFELGRLRMDQLGDVKGAVSALKRAVATAPGSAFREDALARLVRSYGTLGDLGACERTRSDYLASYPGGVHSAAVRKACGHSP